MNDGAPISESEVRHVANLSRLDLSDAELAQFTDQLGQVLEYVNKLAELDLEGVEPLTTAIDQSNVLRPDQPEEGLSVDQALHNAPDQAPPFFKVPKVFE
jgi:aspartyl-tRNA(Asn)/glutamyl-tRNA(Gln) amidotransferase subunit C